MSNWNSRGQAPANKYVILLEFFLANHSSAIWTHLGPYKILRYKKSRILSNYFHNYKCQIWRSKNFKSFLCMIKIDSRFFALKIIPINIILAGYCSNKILYFKNRYVLNYTSWRIIYLLSYIEIYWNIGHINN